MCQGGARPDAVMDPYRAGSWWRKWREGRRATRGEAGWVAGLKGGGGVGDLKGRGRGADFKEGGGVAGQDGPPAAARAAGRRPRLADVAARARVSAGLVSLVLRNQPGPSAPTRARVLEAARELGYRADRTASLLARRRSRHLGVLL